MSTPHVQSETQDLLQPSELEEQGRLPLFEDWSPQMGTAECTGSSWSPPRRVASGTLPVHPGAMGIQFGQSVFEGCKAFWNGKDPALLFRIDEHYKRLVASCDRLRMPAPPEEIFLEAVLGQVKDSASWSSPFSSETLYIRPLIFGQDHHCACFPTNRWCCSPSASSAEPPEGGWVTPRRPRTTPTSTIQVGGPRRPAATRFCGSMPRTTPGSRRPAP